MFQLNSPLHSLKRRWKIILAAGLAVALASLLVSFIFPLEYRADAQVLIISKSRYGVDPYTAVKSAERIGESLVEVVKTNDFYKKIIEQPGYNIDKTRFEQKKNEFDKRKEWSRTVSASVVYGTGVLNISAYSVEPEQAEQLVGAVAEVLSSQGWEYVGGDVAIKIVNEPVVSKYPVRPNLVVNTVLGFIIGALFVGWLAIRKHS